MPISEPLFADGPTSGPPSRSSAVDACLRVLRDAIVSGQLPPGHRLPPERALAERFSVNRVTVRTALARLEAEHLVSVRQGSGYAVRDFRTAGGPDLIATLAALARSSTDRAAIVRDLLAVRRQLARATLERLIEVADEAALRNVDAAIDRFAATVDAGAPMAELASRDLDVVAAFVAATGSAVLQLCFNPVAALVHELPMLQDAMYREPTENVLAYRTVLELVRRGNRGGVDLALELVADRDAATVRAVARSPVATTTKKKDKRR